MIYITFSEIERFFNLDFIKYLITVYRYVFNISVYLHFYDGYYISLWTVKALDLKFSTKKRSDIYFKGMCVSRSVVSNTLWLMDWSPPDSSVHGIFQARIQEWVAISSLGGSSWPRDWTQSPASPALAGRFYTTEPPGKPISGHSTSWIDSDLTAPVALTAPLVAPLRPLQITPQRVGDTKLHRGSSAPLDTASWPLQAPGDTGCQTLGVRPRTPVRARRHRRASFIRMILYVTFGKYSFGASVALSVKWA